MTPYLLLDRFAFAQRSARHRSDQRPTNQPPHDPHPPVLKRRGNEASGGPMDGGAESPAGGYQPPRQ